MKETKITCPKCAHKFNIEVEDLMHQQFKEEYESKFSAMIKEHSLEHIEQQKTLQQEKEKLEQARSDFESSVNRSVKEKLSEEKEKLKLLFKEEVSDEIKSYKEQLEQKVNEVRELNRTRIELEKLKRESAEMAEKLEAEHQARFSNMLLSEKEKIRKESEDRHRLKLQERESVIDQLRKQLSIAQQKAEQGSMQLQGEVLETEIEKWLKENFPLDTIDEIAKGQRGADVLMTVNSRTKSNCGNIYIEAKRTKEWSHSWIEKFKDDMRIKGAQFGIIITAVYPRNVTRVTQIEGIWVCSLEEFRGLVAVIRNTVLLLDEYASKHENRQEKVGLLYDYLTGPEFRMEIESIVSGFTSMQTDLLAEKRSLESIWKKREKQIQKVLNSTTSLYGSIKGIAGDSLRAIEQLELPKQIEE
jgi:hypothetical protein